MTPTDNGQIAVPASTLCPNAPLPAGNAGTVPGRRQPLGKHEDESHSLGVQWGETDRVGALMASCSLCSRSEPPSSGHVQGESRNRT